MGLQQLLKEKIDAYSGIEKLTENLEKCRKMTDEKVWFDNMVIYFNNLYLQEFDVESYALEYRDTSLKTIEFLRKFNKERNIAAVDFLIGLIEYKLEYVANIRKIS